MHSFTLALSLLPMVLSALATNHTSNGFRMHKIHKSHAARTGHLSTNSERFAAGLPPLAPRGKKAKADKTGANKAKASTTPVTPAGPCPDGSAAWSKTFYLAAYASPYDPNSAPLGFVNIGDDPATYPNNINYVADKTQATPLVKSKHSHHHYIIFADPAKTQFQCRAIYWFNSGGDYNSLIDNTVNNAAEMGKVDNPVTADYNGNYYQAHVWQNDKDGLIFHWQNWDQGVETNLDLYADGGGAFYAGQLTDAELGPRGYHRVVLIKMGEAKFKKL